MRYGSCIGPGRKNHIFVSRRRSRRRYNQYPQAIGIFRRFTTSVITSVYVAFHDGLRVWVCLFTSKLVQYLVDVAVPLIPGNSITIVDVRKYFCFDTVCKMDITCVMMVQVRHEKCLYKRFMVTLPVTPAHRWFESPPVIGCPSCAIVGSPGTHQHMEHFPYQ